MPACEFGAEVEVCLTHMQARVLNAPSIAILSELLQGIDGLILGPQYADIVKFGIIGEKWLRAQQSR